MFAMWKAYGDIPVSAGSDSIQRNPLPVGEGAGYLCFGYIRPIDNKPMGGALDLLRLKNNKKNNESRRSSRG